MAQKNITLLRDRCGHTKVHRLNLALHPVTATALQAILDDSPFEEMFTPYSPLQKGQSATFSMKFKTTKPQGE
jgi:hypothetical protein